jgi:1-acyl-sn-glycerol-3-phosphate acyltransferase
VLLSRVLLLLHCSVSLLLLSLPLLFLLLPVSLPLFRLAINRAVVPLWLNAVSHVLPPLAVSLTSARITKALDKLPHRPTPAQLLAILPEPSFPATSLLIANHTIDADFLLIWLLLPLLSPSPALPLLPPLAGNLKIVLKDELKSLPVIGHGMKA